MRHLSLAETERHSAPWNARMRRLEQRRGCAETARLVEGLKDIWAADEVGDSEESLSRALKELMD